MKRLRILRTICGLAFANVAGYCFAQTLTPNIPNVEPLVEKGGVWGLVFFLFWWILGRLSKQLDQLVEAVDGLKETVKEKR